MLTNLTLRAVYTAVQSKNAVSAYFTSKQILPFDFTEQYRYEQVYIVYCSTNETYGNFIVSDCSTCSCWRVLALQSSGKPNWVLICGETTRNAKNVKHKRINIFHHFFRFSFLAIWLN